MIIEHFGFKVDVGKFEFGNEYDMQVRDLMKTIEDILKPRKNVLPKQKEKVIALLKRIEDLVKMKYANKS